LSTALADSRLSTLAIRATVSTAIAIADQEPCGIEGRPIASTTDSSRRMRSVLRPGR
jgi:hypothetical protein